MTRVLVVDFSSVSVVDTTGLGTIRSLFEELADQKIRLLFACVNSTIRHRFKIFGGFDTVPKHYFFPSVHDAVLSAQQMGGILASSVHMRLGFALLFY
jgi:MFS superfamily sulfate permease-like transporter